MNLNICHKCAQGFTEICQDCCKHEFFEIPDRNGMFVNKKCKLCGFVLWGIAVYMAEREAQKLKQGAKEMPIKFIEDDTKSHIKLTFDMVKENQFFVHENGCLGQKISHDEYNLIADENGNPFCISCDCLVNMPILRILPRIIKIEF